MRTASADRAILVSGAVSAALLGWMFIGYRWPFSALLPNAALPDIAIGDHARDSVAAFFRTVANHPEAVALFRAMLTGPELALPAALALFLFLVLRRVSADAEMFGRRLNRPLKAAVLALPFVYGLADYGENLAFLHLLQDPQPAGWRLDLAPWLTALKFAGLSLSVVFLLRFTLLRRLQPRL